jgi:O-antigen/teichoic acid export membrane protein
VFKEQISYGKDSYKYQLASAALVRIDLLAVSYFLGANAAGVYSVALYFAEILMYFPSALTTVLLTAIGGKEHITKGFYRSISTVFLLAIAATAIVLPIAIKVFFSDQYLGAIILAEIMLLGVYWLGMGHIASFHMFGNRNLTQPFRASLIAAVIEICLVLFLIPIGQLSGVAIASAVAYTTFGLITLNQTAQKLSTHIYMLLKPYPPNTFIRRMLTYYEAQK